jgi:hypothetical protein
MHRMRCYLAKAALTLVLAAFLGHPAATRADLINPDATLSFPDLSSVDTAGTQTYTFNPSTGVGTFQVNSAPSILSVGPKLTDEFFVNDPSGQSRNQSIQLQLDSSGRLVTGAGNSYALVGSVTVGGHNYTGTLLTGTPDQFGYLPQTAAAGGMSVYDMHMTITGGQLQALYGADAYVRIIAETSSTFKNSFTQSFSGAKLITNVRSYNLTASAVPEPSTFAILLACGGAGLLYQRRHGIDAADLIDAD